MRKRSKTRTIHKSERRPDVVGGDVVFTLYVLERHAAGQAAHNHRYRHAGALNDGFAVTDGRVDDDAVRGSHGHSDDSDLAGLVECGIPQRLPGRPLGRIALKIRILYQELRFYCQRRGNEGNEGNAGDADSLRISNLLIPKSLPGDQKPIEGSNPSLSATKKSL